MDNDDKLKQLKNTRYCSGIAGVYHDIYSSVYGPTVEDVKNNKLKKKYFIWKIGICILLIISISLYYTHTALLNLLTILLIIIMRGIT